MAESPGAAPRNVERGFSTARLHTSPLDHHHSPQKPEQPIASYIQDPSLWPLINHRGFVLVSSIETLRPLQPRIIPHPICGDHTFPRISLQLGLTPQSSSLIALSDIWRAILGFRDGFGFSGG